MQTQMVCINSQNILDIELIRDIIITLMQMIRNNAEGIYEFKIK